jgi:hypothetical protein
VPALLPHLDPATYRPHRLHGPERCWAETNCYLDLWIELLHALGLPPEAAFGFAARQDFEGDQFGFSKIPLEDLETLYGLRVQELALYDPVEQHVVRQMARGRLCLVEVDPFFLPDTRQAAYRVQHGKTTIGINRIDLDSRRLEYFHNAGYFALEGEDFDGLFAPAPADRMPFRPYVEFTTLEPLRLSEDDLKARAAIILARDWTRRPAENPIRKFQAVFAEQAQGLVGRPMEAFHDFAFHNLRLLGANYDLLGAGLDWLFDGQDIRASACALIAESAKAAQFQLARAVARRKFDTLAASLDPAADAWDALVEAAAVRDAA